MVLQVVCTNEQNQSLLGYTKALATFLFDTIGAKRKVNKRETPQKDFAPCEARQGLRALDPRELLKKFDQNFTTF